MNEFHVPAVPFLSHKKECLAILLFNDMRNNKQQFYGLTSKSPFFACRYSITFT